MRGDDTNPKRPPVAGRFRTGQSGNPKGRPRSVPKPTASAFEIVFNLRIALTRNGQPREVTIEEALQQKIYQAAIAGNRAARKEVLKMIAKREEWQAAHNPKPKAQQYFQHAPRNADPALHLLGIAEPKDRWGNGEYLRLLPWAVQAALSRPGIQLSSKDVENIKCNTRDPDTLTWPPGTSHENKI